MKNDNQKVPAYKNSALSFEERVKDLVSRMTLKEKIAQLGYKAPRIKRLGIEKYDWWNECLHGVGRAGLATVFPQAIGLAASFSEDLLFMVATAISDEARAKHHDAVRKKNFGRYYGLTFWSPNINIFRDPRWGRGQETYGEDPFLTGRLGVAFVKGLQGNDPKYLKLVATPKHFAVHSGPEKDRHHFDAIATPKDMRETYLPHFKESVQEGKAYSVMGAYNRTNGEPCCGSITLLQKILREEWGFNGYVVSDCGAVSDFNLGHKVTKDFTESAAMAVNNGCDLCCGWTYRKLNNSVKKHLITEDTINISVSRLMLARMKLGMFDSPDQVAYQRIPYDVNDCDMHRQLALRATRESLVLLKNEHNLLPLKKELKTIAIIGPNAHEPEVLLGNYNGFPSKSVTPLQGIQNKLGFTTRILYAKGGDLTKMSVDELNAAIDIAKQAEVVIMVLGISNKLEGEETILAHKDDRPDLALLPNQQQLLEAIHKIGKPIVLILLNGSPIASLWAEEHIPAILEAWYPGEEGGTAIADVLWGDYNPAGRLPITIVKTTQDLPPFIDYNMKGRTYRYMEKEPLYPFGFGRSYTTFAYTDLKLNKSQINAGESLEIQVQVQNIGPMNGDEVVQLYLKDIDASVTVPKWDLRGVQRINLNPNEKKGVKFTLTPRQMALIDNEGKCLIEPGKFQIFLGGTQPDDRSTKLIGKPVISANFTVNGQTLEMKY